MQSEKIVALEAFIQKEYANVAGIVVLKQDKMIYENYFQGYLPEDPIHIASVTKSIVSILIGIAIDKGMIKSIDQKVLAFFPEYKVKRGEKNIQEVSMRALLTMTAPYKYKSEPYTKVYSSEDWTKAALDLLGGKGEKGEFKYSTVGIQILAGILTMATGQSVIDFAIENLFEPLGIKAPHQKRIVNKEEYIAFLKDKYVSGWIVDPQGINTAGWGLALTARDMAKIGQLYLNKGIWKGQQIISPQWIQESTTEQSRWGKLSYGYLWWMIDGKQKACYAALGDGGNVIYVDPNTKMVVAMTSQFMPRAKDRIELIKTHIVPLSYFI